MKLPPLRETTPAINFVKEQSLYVSLMKVSLSAYHKVGDKTLVKYAKEVLGKQTRTFNGEFRCYLWEFPKYTIWVSNGKGFDIEVLPSLTKEEAIDSYLEGFYRLGGIKPEDFEACNLTPSGE